MFSGGFDLAVFTRSPQEIHTMLEAGARLTQRLLGFPRPVLAACTGHAVAMGAFLLLSTDVRIGVDQGARIQVNEVQIGLTVPRFAIEICRQRLSPAHLNQAVTTAEPYSPQQAVAAGFLDEVVAADSFAALVQRRAAALAKLHAESFTATKLRLRAETLRRLQEAVDADIADWAARIGAAA
jgi:enoyl-CoA hydratase